MDLSFNPLLAFSWSILAGFLMSMGAGGGGILAGIGHISILGIADANMIKVINQLLELTSRFFSVPIYFKQKRLIWPLALSFGIGAPIGAVVGSWASSTYLESISDYKIAFGILVILVAGRTLYESVRPARQKEKTDLAGATSVTGVYKKTFSDSGNPHTKRRILGVTSFGLLRIEVQVGNDRFHFNPLVSILGGFSISFVGAMLGVGGGFLVTPFMASILIIPMFFAVGTALVALMIPLTASVITYLYLNTYIEWTLVIIEIPGIAIGSVLGPLVNRRINERSLKLFVAAVLLVIGMYYLLW
jgi:hypothetical protein